MLVERCSPIQQVTGMAATGNMSLIEHMGAVMGRELRAINNIVKVGQRMVWKGM